jgi:gamma-resorcylate decarboxylase
MFSADYPYEQMDSAARWFDDMQLDPSLKLKIGRENANRLFKLGLPSSTASLAAAFGS